MFLEFLFRGGVYPMAWLRNVGPHRFEQDVPINLRVGLALRFRKEVHDVDRPLDRRQIEPLEVYPLRACRRSLRNSEAVMRT
jgi:hypothetical protein